jgi:hypothetical protein
MPFDHQVEADEPASRIELVFNSGRNTTKDGLPMPPSAYIAMGWFTGDADGRIKITTEEMSYEALKTKLPM